MGETASADRAGDLGGLSEIAAAGSPSARAIEVWLRQQIAQILEVEPETIDVHEPFAGFGMLKIGESTYEPVPSLNSFVPTIMNVLSLPSFP